MDLVRGALFFCLVRHTQTSFFCLATAWAATTHAMLLWLVVMGGCSWCSWGIVLLGAAVQYELA